MYLSQALTILGAICAATLTFKLIRTIIFWSRTGSLERYRYRYDNQEPWALVTGPSDGIGLGLAHELANTGFNIVLHGRNPTKLEAAKKAILSESPNIQIRYVIADVCTPGDGCLNNIQAIVEELKDIHLTVLINNVGGPAPNMDPKFKTFDKTTALEIDDHLYMNIRFTCHLTSLLIPRFLKTSKPALIINVSSGADLGLPYIAMYSGCKGFMDSWTTALRREMRAEEKDVEVMCIRPLKVTNTSFRKEKGDWNMPDARTFAKGALNKIGGELAVTEGVWGHAVMGRVTECLPESMLMSVLVKAMKEEVEKDKKLH